MFQISVQRKVTIPSIVSKNPDIEERLRILLHQEQEKNAQLNADYRSLRMRNLDLMASLRNIKNENERLIQENQRLKDTIFSHHNYC